jgi:hypothetical protein
LASTRAFSQAAYAKWTAEFLELYHLVVLTGTRSVRTLADDLFELFQRIDHERMSYADERFANALTRAFQRYEGELERTRIELIAAMRADVAAERATFPSAELRSRPAMAESARTAERAAEKHSVAVICTSNTISHNELERVVQAIQQQVT